MEAYLRAICNQACCQVAKLELDVNKIDMSVNHEDVPTPVQLQLKASSPLKQLSDGTISFSLDADTHKVLSYQRDRLPRYLLLMDLPAAASEWLEEHPDRIHLKHKIYWYSVMGEPTIQTAETSLRVPLSNIFDVRFLLQLFEAINSGLPVPGQP